MKYFLLIITVLYNLNSNAQNATIIKYDTTKNITGYPIEIIPTPLDAAIIEAKKMDKILFIKFTTSWCAPCKIFDESVLKNIEVMLLLQKNFITVTINGENIDYGIDNALKYNITSYPTFLFTKPEGKIIQKYVGNMGSKKFISCLNEVSKKFSKKK